MPGGAGGAEATDIGPDRPDVLRPTREMLLRGAQVFRSVSELNAIPAVVLGDEREGAGGEAPGAEGDAWVAAACAAVTALLGGDR